MKNILLVLATIIAISAIKLNAINLPNTPIAPTANTYGANTLQRKTIITDDESVFNPGTGR